MANYSTDKDGIMHYRDNNNVVKFDRANAVVVAGWSNDITMKVRGTSFNETTGKHTSTV